MAKKITQQAPDVFLTADFADLFNKVFGPDDKRNNAEQTRDAISQLSTNELVAFRAYIGYREAQFREVNSVLDEALAQKGISDFPSESTLFSVSDKETQENVGGVRVETVVTTIRSTKNKSTVEKVKEALKTNGILDKYTKQSVELQNDVLFEAKDKGTLPSSVANLLTETTKSERVSSYIPIKTLKGTEE